MESMATVKTKRVYEPREKSDGTRILVMRFWPRGIRKEHFDEWNRDVAPSKDLVFAFKRHGLPWEGYVRLYRAGLNSEAVDALRSRKGTITLLCGCEDETHCHRTLLKGELEAASTRRPASSGTPAPKAPPRARRGGRPGSRS